jgi:hypothetical protein
MMSPEVSAAVIGGVIGAGAALVASVIGAYFAMQAAKETIQSDREALLTQIGKDRENLSAQLASDSAVSQEAIKQQRIERAYIRIIAYTNLVAYYNAINHRVFQREMDTVQSIRKRDGVFDPASAEGKAALSEAAATEDELRLLKSGPTVAEDAEMFALVDCLASEAVQKKFDEFRDIVTTINDQMIKVRSIFRRDGRTIDSTPNTDGTAEPQVLASSGDDGDPMSSDELNENQAASRPWAEIKRDLQISLDTFGPTMVIFQATLKMKPAQNELVKLIRTELTPNGSNTQAPATAGVGLTGPLEPMVPTL